MTKPLRIRNAAGHAFRKLIAWTSSNEADVATSPTITGGSGVPTASEPKGSFYLRTDGAGSSEVAYVATDAAGTWAPLTA